MGFMAGFGKSFSDTFNQTQAQDAAADRDAFQVAYATHAANQKQYEADKKADEAAKKTAKDIVSSLPGVDAGAWTHAYNWLKDGFSPGQVEQKLTTTKFSAIPVADVAPTPPTVDGIAPPHSKDDLGRAMKPELLSTAPVNDADIQVPPDETQASGMGGADKPTDLMTSTDPTLTNTTTNETIDPNAGQPAPASPDLLGNVGKGIQNKFAEIGNPVLQQQHMGEKANAGVMGASGQTQEEFDKINSGYLPETPLETVQAVAPTVSPLSEFGLDKEITPAKLSSAISDATVGLKSDNPDLQQKALRFMALLPDIQMAMKLSKDGSGADAGSDPEYMKAITTALEHTQPDRQKLMTTKGNVTTMAKAAMDLGTLVEDNGSLLTWGAQGLTGANTIKNNLMSLLDIAKSLTNDPKASATEDSFVTQVDAWANQNLPGWEKTSAAEREFDAKVVRFVYAYGQSKGVSGQSQSDKDYARLNEAVANSNDPTQFIDNLKTIVSEEATHINDQTSLMLESADLVPLLKDTTGVGDALRKNLAPLDLGSIQGWIDTPTNDSINTNPLASKPTPPGAAPVPGKAPVVTDQGIVNNEIAAQALAKQIGKPVKVGQTYQRFDDGHTEVK